MVLFVAVLSGWQRPAAAASGAAGWRPPLSPPLVVRAGFQAPAGPYGPGHRGVDLAAGPAAQVTAAGAGVVVFAGRVAGRGVVSVQHPGGLRTTYEPVSALVTRGTRVVAGAPLGLLAAVGGHCAVGSCLHWGVRRGQAYLDPLALIRSPKVRLLPVWSPAGTAPVPTAGPAGVAPSRRPALRPRAGPVAAGQALAAAAAGAALLAGVGLLRLRGPPAGSQQ